MRVFLINTTILQIIVCILTTFLQARVVPNKKTVSLLCLGPCKYFGQQLCAIIYKMHQMTHIASATSILLSFFYRFKLLKTGGIRMSKTCVYFVISYLIPLIGLILSLISASDLNEITAELQKLHPTYQTSNYAIVGYSDVEGPTAAINSLFYAITIYLSPVLAFYYRKKILNFLDRSKKEIRSEKINQSKSMIMGLTIQSIFPLISYIPVLTYYAYSTYGNVISNMLLEYIVSVISILFTIVDPVLTIYFVLPYRRAVKKFWTGEKPSPGLKILVSDTHETVFTVQRVGVDHFQPIIEN
ncbi:unnamed protein product [Caenorhabditis angaria]|uniref:G-protein coupled receptors family 1 profile domain-containing protein n=1 Tax=Caenorhabditis angaria TaxID=860376 RepID=A0A9P1J1L2_9PELO|nr:unnamed protein product [Caenorhabditis angaria]